MITTVQVETPKPPDWANTPAGRWAWKNIYWWRCDATRAETIAMKRLLLRDAELRYER